MVLNRKHKLLLILGLLLFLSISYFIYFSQSRFENSVNYQEIVINNRVLSTEVVDTPFRQYLGLSNRDFLCSECGMLFVFPEKQIHEFVMRNMSFPLDIVFINSNRITNIAENLNPEGGSPVNSYKSSEPGNLVLELNGGYCLKYGIKVGDLIVLKGK